MTEVDLQNSGMTNDVERKRANTTATSNSQSSIAMPIANDGGDKKPSTNGEKKRAPFGIFKAALFMMRRPAAGNREQNKKSSTTKSSSDKAAEQDGKWKKLVGSMRPLHLQDNRSPPASLKGLSPSPTAENLEELARRPSSASSPSSVSGGMSQYASACNLQELDCTDEEDDDPDEVFDALRGDEMIDAKAEEFIAQFYNQMKLQQYPGGPAQ